MSAVKYSGRGTAPLVGVNGLVGGGVGTPSVTDVVRPWSSVYVGLACEFGVAGRVSVGAQRSLTLTR